jgi:lipoprotein-anchoring transpeptidase ErfK/SrfK
MKSSLKSILIVTTIALVAGGFFIFYKNTPRVIKSDSSVTEIPVQVVPEIPKDITYHSVVLATDKPLTELTTAVGKENLPTVLGLNRIDKKFIRKGMTIIVPDSFTDWMEYSPFSKNVSSLQTVPKIILVSQKIQAFGVYENGVLVRWGPVSTGKKSTPTPPALYHTNWKGKSVTSTVDPTWIMLWYFNLQNLEGISMHQYELPGYAASHSCVRLREEDALFFYNWADQWILSSDKQSVVKNGTPVIIFGEYDYKVKSPWKNLPTNKDAAMVSEDQVNQEVAPYTGKLGRE